LDQNIETSFYKKVRSLTNTPQFLAAGVCASGGIGLAR